MLHDRIQAWTGTLPPVRCPLVTGLRPQSGQSGSSGLEAPRGGGRGMGYDCSEAPGHAGDKARSGGFPSLLCTTQRAHSQQILPSSLWGTRL